MAFDRTKFIARFVDEAREHLHKLNEGLLSLGKNPDDPETVNALFRSAHTIKGSSKMMKLTAITEIAHKLEDALGALREKKIQHSKALSNLLFKGIDIIADMVDKVATGQEVTGDTQAICEALERAAEGSEIEEPVIPAERGSKDEPPAQAEDRGQKPSPLTDSAPASSISPVSVPSVVEGSEGRGQGEEIQPKKELLKREIPPQVESPPTAPTSAGKGAKPKTEETVRISAERLDELIKLMGEMVSNQSRLKQRLSDIKEVERLSKRTLSMISRLNGQISSNGHRDEILNAFQSIHLKLTQLASSIRDDASLQELLTHDLQEKALRMRMLPLSTVFDSFHRSVRDMSRDLKKDIDLILEGEETELDKKMIEKIGDPLLHMLRNAVDHGIEKPEERRNLGKPERGTIRLSAYYEGGSVSIELSDDGGGISLKKIKEKALRKNLFDEQTLETMSEPELIDLIFYPGFSTSPIITDISGRGVGLDVVKKNIVEDLKGTIRIKTKEGEGTTFYLRLPLTLAIMRVLLITASDMIFAVPASSVTEILRVPKTEIIDVVDRRAIRLREQIIPVVNLDVLLNLPTTSKRDERDLLIIIVYVGSEKLGLIVDTLLDEEDMVIKPLPSHMKNIQWVSGITITGNNDLVNVLHIPMIIEAAKEIKEAEYLRKRVKEEKKTIHILIVDDSLNTREIEKSILEAYGYQVDLAGDGLEALEKAKELKYDLVVTDVEMPRLDGFSLTEKLRADPEYKDTPIVIVTSRDREEDKRRGIQVGADAYILKGDFDQSNLLETVQSLLG